MIVHPVTINSMQKSYLFFLFLIIVIPKTSLGQNSTWKQDTIPSTSFFNSYNFESGAYQLLLFETGVRVDSPKYYYSNDIAYLKSVQKSLTGNVLSTIYPFFCHETQVLYLCKGDSVIETVSFSTNCRSAETPNGAFLSYGFIPTKMNSLHLQKHQFTTAWQADSTIQQIQKDTNLVFVSTENWMHYEGKFGFFYEHKNYHNETVKKEILEQLKERFPTQRFEIYVNGGSGSSKTVYNYHITVHCQKKLFDKFTFARVDNRKWQPFPIIFNSYWK